MVDAELQVRLRHRFPSGFALDVELHSVERVTGLFGPSGAGKTSVLLAIAGHLHPDAGRIRWRDRVLLDRDAGVCVPAERRRLGVVFQDQRLFPHLDVAANLRYGSRRRGGAAPFAEDDVVDVLDLGALLDRAPATLSGGERQRVALGRALLSQPELLLLDEPVGAVDEARRGSILRYVERMLAAWDLPMIYVSHQRSDVQRIAGRVIALDAGRVVTSGPPERVLGAAGTDRVAGEPVNLLRLVRARRDDGQLRARLPGSPDLGLTLHPPEPGAAGNGPEGDGGVEGQIYVEFSPTDVLLAAGDLTADGGSPRLSARNLLPGRVGELVPRHGWIYVSVLVGDQTVWAEVTPEAASELGLRAGAEVTCLVKAAAIRLVG